MARRSRRSRVVLTPRDWGPARRAPTPQDQNGAALQFMREQERCPVGVEELVEDTYLTRDAAGDPWGKRLLVQCFVQGDEVAMIATSAGNYGAFGTYDDVVETAL